MSKNEEIAPEIAEPQTLAAVSAPESEAASELGTIPAPFTEQDARKLIKKIGLEQWRGMGYHKRLAALESAGK